MYLGCIYSVQIGKQSNQFISQKINTSQRLNVCQTEFQEAEKSVKQIRQILVLRELRFNMVGERDRRGTPSPEDVLERKTCEKAERFLSTLRGWCLSRQLPRCMSRTWWATHRGRAILILQRNCQETRGAYKA